VAARVEELERTHSVGFIAASRYTTAAQLGFALHDADVTALADRHDQYDFWFDSAAHLGEDAIVVSDTRLGIGQVKPYFEALKLIETVSFERFGRVIYRARIYLGSGFHLPEKS
jgi:hypothetical protein